MNQQEIWNQILPEWDEYRKSPAEHTIEFLKTSGQVLGFGKWKWKTSCKNKRRKMYLLDFSKEMLKFAKKKKKNQKNEKINADLKQAKLWEIPYENEFFCLCNLHFSVALC